MPSPDPHEQSHSKRKARRKVTVTDAESVIAQTILDIAKVNGTVSADDVHRVLEIPPECMKFVAHVFRALQMRGLIRIVRIVNTPRDGQHGNRIAIWELVPGPFAESVVRRSGPRKPKGSSGAAVNN